MNNIKEDIEILEDFKTIKVMYGNTFVMTLEQLENKQQAIDNILKDRKKWYENYFGLLNKIENKIDYFDMQFEKAKRKNDVERADFYWDLIINFKKLLEK